MSGRPIKRTLRERKPFHCSRSGAFFCRFLRMNSVTVWCDPYF